MKSTYSLRVRPAPFYALMQGIAPLSHEALMQALAGATIRALSQTNWGDSIIDLRLQRPSHEEALNDIFVAVQGLGYEVVESTVSEWANAAAQTAFVGALGGGAVGSQTRQPLLAIGAAVVGCLVGAAAGSLVEGLKVTYQVQRAPSGWVLTPMSQEAPDEAAFRPGFAES